MAIALGAILCMSCLRRAAVDNLNSLIVPISVPHEFVVFI